MKLKIENAWLVTMQGEDPPYKGDLLIENDRIMKLGDCSEDEADEVIDGTGFAALPGLVNTHQHSPMSLLRAYSDDLKLMDWLDQKILPAEANMKEEDIRAGARLAMAEMIKSGTTTFADMYIHMNAIAETVEEAGMRASLTRGLVFLEPDGGGRLSEALDLIDKWHGKAEGRITTMLGPHAPYTCPPDAIRKVMKLAEERDIPIHIHLAETVEEVASIKLKYGQTPAEYLHELGLFDQCHVLLAHGVHLTHSDIQLLKGMQGGVSHNPVSNLKLGCGIAPVLKLQQEGVIVGLGTDGAGSATLLDMFAEMKAAAWMQKLHYGDPTILPAKEVLKMATIHGANLLRLGHEIGTLSPGKKADLILINLNKPHLAPLHQLESLLAYGVSGADVDTVIVNGKVLMRDRKLLTIDEAALISDVQSRAERIVRGV